MSSENKAHVETSSALPTVVLISLDEILSFQNNLATIEGYSINVYRQQPDYPTSYYSLRNLSNTNGVEMYWSKRGQQLPLGLPSEILERFGQYLMEERDIDYEGCASFIHRLKGMPYTWGEMNEHQWKLTQIGDDNSLAAGDAIAFINHTTEGVRYYPHQAIYLGKGLYLSKPGIGQKLMVTGIDQMLAAYPALAVLKMEPSTPHQSVFSININLPSNFTKISQLKINH